MQTVSTEQDLRSQIDLARQKLWEATTDEELRLWCRWSMVQLSQAIAELEAAYSPNELRQLYLHWDISVRRVHRLESQPIAQLAPILVLLKKFGRFLVRQTETTPTHGAWLPRDCATALPTTHL